MLPLSHGYPSENVARLRVFYRQKPEAECEHMYTFLHDRIEYCLQCPRITRWVKEVVRSEAPISTEGEPFEDEPWYRYVEYLEATGRIQADSGPSDCDGCIHEHWLLTSASLYICRGCGLTADHSRIHPVAIAARRKEE